MHIIEHLNLSIEIEIGGVLKHPKVSKKLSYVMSIVGRHIKFVINENIVTHLSDLYYKCINEHS